jgi:hypothetical protein
VPLCRLPPKHDHEYHPCILDHVCGLISLQHVVREMGIDRPTITAWLKARLLQPIDVLGELMVPREQLAEFEQFARMGYFDKTPLMHGRTVTGSSSPSSCFRKEGFAE